MHDWQPDEDAKGWGLPEWLGLAAVVVAVLLAVVLVARRHSFLVSRVRGPPSTGAGKGRPPACPARGTIPV